MAGSTAGVAGLGTATTIRAEAATLGTVAGNVANLTTLVALLRNTGSAEAATTALGTLAGKVTGHTATVAGALLGRVGALPVLERALISLQN